MLVSNYTEVAWNSRNKNHYVSLGYEYTKMGDKFKVKVEDLTNGSSAVVKLECDYCGKEFNQSWCTYNYLHRKCIISTDCCKECCEEKANDAVIEKYGSHTDKFLSSNQKRKNTNIARYGSENVFASDEIKGKIISTNLCRYGVEYNQQCEEVRNKTKATCKERYGVENYIELFKGRFIGENSPVWKGGAEHSRTERATFEYNEWRKKVFVRDKFTCARCGRKNGNGVNLELHAHHILNWRDNPGGRYDENNGITLCASCHYEFHSIYGKRYNDLSQIDEFLKQTKRYAELMRNES